MYLRNRTKWTGIVGYGFIFASSGNFNGMFLVRLCSNLQDREMLTRKNLDIVTQLVTTILMASFSYSPIINAIILTYTNFDLMCLILSFFAIFCTVSYFFMNFLSKCFRKSRFEEKEQLFWGTFWGVRRGLL